MPLSFHVYLVDDNVLATKTTQHEVSRYELHQMDFPVETVTLSWSNVVSFKVCSTLCLNVNITYINAWAFHKNGTKCSCLNLSRKYQCRQLWGLYVTNDNETSDLTISVMAASMDIVLDCTGNLTNQYHIIKIGVSLEEKL